MVVDSRLPVRMHFHSLLLAQDLKTKSIGRVAMQTAQCKYIPSDISHVQCMITVSVGVFSANGVQTS